MKVAGMRMNDPWASRAVRKGTASETVSSAAAETVVLMERVSIEHHGPEKNYRPLLHLTGELRTIRPEEPLPHGVREVTFRAGTGPTMDAFYEFDDPQLGQLVAKGYFTEGFEAPASMAGTEWELPTTIDALILPPAAADDTPVVFVNIHGQTALALDARNSGYVLADYFENHQAPETSLEGGNAFDQGAPEVPTSTGTHKDLFADEVFIQTGAPFTGAEVMGTGDFPVVRASIFEDLIAELGDKLPVIAPVAAPETADSPETEGEAEADELLAPADDIYRDRIAPGVADALALQAETTEAAEAGADTAENHADAGSSEPQSLDLFSDDDIELGVVPLAIAPEDEAPAPAPLTPEQADSAAPRVPRPAQRAVMRELALDLQDDKSDEPGLG